MSQKGSGSGKLVILGNSYAASYSKSITRQLTSKYEEAIVFSSPGWTVNRRTMRQSTYSAACQLFRKIDFPGFTLCDKDEELKWKFIETEKPDFLFVVER